MNAAAITCGSTRCRIPWMVALLNRPLQCLFVDASFSNIPLTKYESSDPHNLSNILSHFPQNGRNFGKRFDLDQVIEARPLYPQVALVKREIERSCHWRVGFASGKPPGYAGVCRYWQWIHAARKKHCKFLTAVRCIIGKWARPPTLSTPRLLARANFGAVEVARILNICKHVLEKCLFLPIWNY